MERVETILADNHYWSLLNKYDEVGIRHFAEIKEIPFDTLNSAVKAKRLDMKLQENSKRYPFRAYATTEEMT